MGSQYQRPPDTAIQSPVEKLNTPSGRSSCARHMQTNAKTADLLTTPSPPRGIRILLNKQNGQLD